MQPHNPTNGDVSWSSLQIGSEAVFSCNPGFDLIGSSTATCKIDSTWSDVSQKCERMYLLRFKLFFFLLTLNGILVGFWWF